MAVSSAWQVLGLLGAGALGGLGLFFWFAAVMSQRYGDETGRAFGRLIALVTLVSMVGLLLLVFGGLP